MIEKVNPSHPDKVADRIAGAIVDLAYKKQENPKIAVEVLIGHGYGHVVIETSAPLEKEDVAFIVERMAPGIRVFIQIVPQDVHLASTTGARMQAEVRQPSGTSISRRRIRIIRLQSRLTCLPIQSEIQVRKTQSSLIPLVAVVQRS